jgi:hypothetical protein
METLVFKTPNMTNRRNFIKTLGRGVAFAGLAGITGYLTFRDNPAEGEACNFDFACKNCKRLSSCTLPEATEVKQKKGSDGKE